jgi:hypothetical protein
MPCKLRRLENVMVIGVDILGTFSSTPTQLTRIGENSMVGKNDVDSGVGESMMIVNSSVAIH